MLAPASLRMNRLCWMLVLTCVLAIRPGAGHAQPAQVEAYVEADSLRIGERTTLWMVVEHSFQSQVVFPDADTGPTLFGDLEVLGRSAPGYRYMGAERSGGRIDSIGYTVTTFALDKAEVPALPAWIVQSRDTTIAGADPFTVPVPSVLPSDTTTAMQPLMPPVAFPYTWSQWAAMSALVFALLMLGLWGYWRYRRQGEAGQPASSQKPDTAYGAATATLNSLSPPGAHAEAKAFYTALTQALRTYLAARLRIPARERTSAELVAALQRHPRVPESSVERIQQVLQQADLAKFAATYPDATTNRNALQETKQAVSTIEEALTKVESPAAHERVLPDSS